MAIQTESNIESIQGMSYQEYVEGKMIDKTLQFQFAPFFSNERIFLKGFGKALFYTCLFGYMIAPIILVPLIAYKYEDWYLLFGIAFSYFSTFLALRKQQWQWAAPLLFMFWYWYKNGFYLDDYVNFFWLCLLWGGWMYSLAVGYEEEFAKISIMKDPDLFNDLSQTGIIFFLRKKVYDAVSDDSDESLNDDFHQKLKEANLNYLDALHNAEQEIDFKIEEFKKSLKK